MTEFSDVQKQYLENLFLKLNNTIEEKTSQIQIEFKEKVEEVKKEISTRFNILENKIHTLEDQNKKLKHSVLNLERKVRKNNIAIFGVSDNETNLIKCVCSIFQNILGLEIGEEDLNDAYRIVTTKNTRTPVIVEFISYQKKFSVLKNAKKLKGTNIYIAKDQCLEDQIQNKILIKHLKEARSKGAVAYIKGDRLIISNEPYTIDQLEKETEIEDQEIVSDEVQIINIEKPRPESAPATPNLQRKTKRQIEEIEIEDQSDKKKSKPETINKDKTIVVMKTRSNAKIRE